MANKRSKPAAPDPAAQNFAAGLAMVGQHPLFEPLFFHLYVTRLEDAPYPLQGWAVVNRYGHIFVHPTRRAEPEEWLYILAHCALHLAFGHFPAAEAGKGAATQGGVTRGAATPPADGDKGRWAVWNAACDVFITRFLADLKLGQPPAQFQNRPDLPALPEERLYRQFVEQGVPPYLRGLSTAFCEQAAPGKRLPVGAVPDGSGALASDLMLEPERNYGVRYYHPPQTDWAGLFASGLAQAAASAVDVAGGQASTLLGGQRNSIAQRARAWFINSYPLLGALAAAFTVIEDPAVCQRLEVSVAAVDPELKEIYLNPAAGLDVLECRFVMAHELLHVGLRHAARRQGRDPFLWNVACDYVINAWLVQMRLGALPQVGLLYDPALQDESAEAVYDRMVGDLRRYRKLATLRGVGLGDLLERGRPDWWRLGEGVDLDAFYRRCLAQGLGYHQSQGRGLLPAGLVEEIQALSQPPVPWDVALARWFDQHFPPLEKRQSYARPSRRQSASPDIPRPSLVLPLDQQPARTFGVLLDTSGSMDRRLLAQALGAIASYSLSRDVPAVRVVFCDAAVYDQGYLAPHDIAGRVQVRGRGGTLLQPGVDLLERAPDFPPDGPLLIITDGQCDRLHILREHAFLLPQGYSLPFAPRGPVFRLGE